MTKTPQPAPVHWPFGQLTPEQMKARQAQLRAMQRDRQAKWLAAPF